MGDNYTKIIQNNLGKIFSRDTAARELVETLPAELKDNALHFRAFGEDCRMGPDGLFLGDQKEEGPRGIVITLYALNVTRYPMVQDPLKSFKDFPGTMPYVGAFNAYTQLALVPFVEQIEERMSEVVRSLDGQKTFNQVGGDFAFIVYPLPKVGLCYIFYEADEDFPASVTCLFSNNAGSFLPNDGLADVGEYTTKKIIDVLKA